MVAAVAAGQAEGPSDDLKEGAENPEAMRDVGPRRKTLVPAPSTDVTSYQSLLLVAERWSGYRKMRN